MKHLLGLLAGLFLVVSLTVVGLVAIAGVAAQGTQAGSAEVGALHGPAVPSEFQDAESKAACAGVPVGVLGALGFVASGSGRWLDRPAPWAAAPSGPLGLGAGSGSVAHQIEVSGTALCWLVAQSGLEAGLAQVVGTRFVAVIGVLAASLEEAPLLSAARAQAITFAAEALGVPYQWGGNGPSTYDCSGLMVAAWSSAGVELPRVAQAQHDRLTDAHGHGAPGDLVFYGASPNEVTHVGMWIHAGVLLNAPSAGTVVRLDPMRLDSAISVGLIG